jgi:hypothetical protein
VPVLSKGSRRIFENLYSVDGHGHLLHENVRVNIVVCCMFKMDI